MGRDRRSLARRGLEPGSAGRERFQFEHLPYVAPVSDQVIALRDGDVMATLALEGVAAETAETRKTDALARAFAAAIAQSGDGFAAYVHRLSVPAEIGLPPVAGDGFAAELDFKWRGALEAAALQQRNLYVTLVARPSRATGILGLRALAPEALRRARQKRVEALEEAMRALETALAPARPRRLTLSSGAWLGFLGALLTGRLEPRRPGVELQAIAEALPTRRLLFARDRISILGTGALETRHAAILSLKTYPPETIPGLFDRLDMPLDMIVTQSFTPKDSQTALERIKLVRRQMRAAEDSALSLADQLEMAADDVASGRAVFGEHHMSAAIFAETEEMLEDAVAAARRVGAEAGAALVREDMLARATWFAQHPGNFAYRARAALVSDANFAGMAALHANPSGLCAGDVPWGAPVTVLPTLSGEPFRFNFHRRANPGELSIGHTLVIGPTGSGKTLGTAFLMAQAERVWPRILVFDKDRGLEAVVRALGGDYAPVRMGVPTGFNPLAAEADARGAAWLADWIALLADGEIAPAQSQAIAEAVRRNAEAPEGLRNFESFAELFRALDDGGDLLARLSDWRAGGRHGWLFGGKGADALALEARILGFDLTEILESPRLRTAWLAYVFRRIERLVEDRRPTLIVLDEAWRLLDDAYFGARLKDWMLTMRKKNVAVVMLTQTPSHLTDSAAGRAIRESAATLLLFQNPGARAADYDALGLNAREIGLVAGASPAGSRAALVKSGETSALVDMDLSALGDALETLQSPAPFASDFRKSA